MLNGRRWAVALLFAVVTLPLLGVDLFGQAKDKAKEKTKDAKKDGGNVTLEWKFKKGTPFYQKMTTNTTQNMKVMNNEVKQEQSQTFWFSWTPMEEKDGKWIVAQKILGVQMKIDIGGSPINYDSTAPANNNASNPLSEFFKALVGSEFRLTIDPKPDPKTGMPKIVAIEGQKDFIDKLIAANRQMEGLLKQILSDKALMEMAEPTFAIVQTGKPIKKDDSWKKTTELDMGPIGKYTNEHTYTYEGEDSAKLDKISVKTKLIYKAPETTPAVGGLPFKIAGADLKSKDATGTILFNREKGRVEKSDTNLELDGNLDIDIGGQKTKVELKQKQVTQITSYDTNPLENKAK